MQPSSSRAGSPRDPVEIGSKTISYRVIHAADLPDEGLRLERGFFFGMVENGTIRETDATGEHLLTAGQLLLLSPSRSCTLTAASNDFQLLGIGMHPDFFDTLPDGQPMYGQLTRRPDPTGPIRLRPDPEAWRHLRLTAALYADGMAPFPSCRRGIVRHWCGLFLLQVTDILHRDNNPAAGPISVRRADLLFRDFKKLSVEHYRQRHDIGFYADALHISPTYLSRIVKRTTGHTVYAHLAGLLAAEARRFLESTDMDVKEIADRLGFSDQSSFGKFFKSQSGLSPQHYRQRFGRTSEPAEIENDK